MSMEGSFKSGRLGSSGRCRSHTGCAFTSIAFTGATCSNRRSAPHSVNSFHSNPDQNKSAVRELEGSEAARQRQGGVVCSHQLRDLVTVFWPFLTAYFHPAALKFQYRKIKGGSGGQQKNGMGARRRQVKKRSQTLSPTRICRRTVGALKDAMNGTGRHRGPARQQTRAGWQNTNVLSK